MAFSLSVPVGFPSASRSTIPPGGSGVFASMPAARNAARLATPTCASARRSHALTSPGNHSAVGSSPPQLVWSHPPPSTHASSSSRATRSATSRSNASRDATRDRSSCASLNPPETRWRCASWRPGTTHPPPREIRGAPSPAARDTLPSRPTASTRPASVTAIASAQGTVASPVHMVASTKTRTAAAGESSEGAARGWGPSASRSTRPKPRGHPPDASAPRSSPRRCGSPPEG